MQAALPLLCDAYPSSDSTVERLAIIEMVLEYIRTVLALAARTPARARADARACGGRAGHDSDGCSTHTSAIAALQQVATPRIINSYFQR